MVECKIFLAGDFISTSKTLSVTNKYTGKLFTNTFLADKDILDKAIVAAEKSKPLCKALSSHEKYIALKYISEELEKNKKHLGKVLCIESGKPIIYAIGEIERAA